MSATRKLKYRGVATPAAFGVAAAFLLGSAAVAAAEETTPAPSDQLAEVVVTGSLITDPNHVASSPIVITSAEDLKQSGSVSIESALKQLPQF
jgi:iron complex outermembrane receptor protein